MCDWAFGHNLKLDLNPEFKPGAEDHSALLTLVFNIATCDIYSQIVPLHNYPYGRNQQFFLCKTRNKLDLQELKRNKGFDL